MEESYAPLVLRLGRLKELKQTHITNEFHNQRIVKQSIHSDQDRGIVPP